MIEIVEHKLCVDKIRNKVSLFNRPMPFNPQGKLSIGKTNTPTRKEYIYIVDQFLCRLPGIFMRSISTSLYRRSIYYPTKREINRLYYGKKPTRRITTLPNISTEGGDKEKTHVQNADVVLRKNFFNTKY